MKTKVRKHIRRTKRKPVVVRRHKRRVKSKHKMVPIDEADKISFYHGTSKEKAAKILEEGLKRDKDRRSLKNFGKVSLTAYAQVADRYAKEGSGSAFGDVPVEEDREPSVLKVTIDKDDVLETTENEELAELRWKNAQKAIKEKSIYGGEYQFYGDISPDKIKRVSPKKIKRKSKLENWKEADVDL